MKKNIILLAFVSIIGVFFLEIFASTQLKGLITRNGFTKDLIIFYDHYYKVLHHLGRLNEVDANNPSSLIFDEIGNGKSQILIQGDSWAEQFRSKSSQKYLQKFLNNQNIKFIRANVGDRHVKEKMKKNNFNLGGEQSGHIILGKFATTGDGLLVALEILFSLRKGVKASKIFNNFKITPQVLVNINVKDKNICN